jgi:hypothetical protein
MTGRTEALTKIVELARAENISAGDIAQAMKEPGSERSAGITIKLFGYLAGVFIFSGIAAYIGMFWQAMGSFERVIITLGSGFILFVIGAISSRNNNVRAATPLLLIAALLQPTGLFIAIDEYFSHGGDVHYPAMFVFGVMLVQQGLAFKSLRQAILLCSAIGFAALFMGATLDLMHVSPRWISIGIGLSLLLVTYGIKDSPYQHISGFWYLIGSTLYLSGAFDLLKNKPFELLYLAITCFMVYVSVLAQSTVLLAVSLLAMLSYIGYFTGEHFVHSMGWPAALIVLGVAFFSISAGALRIKKKYL